MPSRSQIYQTVQRTPSPPSRVSTSSTLGSEEASPYSGTQQSSSASGSPTGEQNFFGVLAARVRGRSRSRPGTESEFDPDFAFRSRSRSPHQRQAPPTAVDAQMPAQSATTDQTQEEETTDPSSTSTSARADRQYSLISEASTLVEPNPTPARRPQHSSHRRNASESSKNQPTTNMFYGRHSNDWLFNGFSVRDHVKELLPRRKRRDT